MCYHLFNKLPASGNNCSACFRLGGGLQGPGSGAFPGLLSFPGVPGFTPSASPAALSGLHNPTMPSALLQVGTDVCTQAKDSELPDLILHENSFLSLSRLIPPLLWKASPLSPTASPTTLQAQETPSPFSQACILGGSEIHFPLLTFNTQPVSPVSS